MLIGFRAAQGAAAAVMLPQVLTFIQSEFEPGAKPKAFALYGMILALAGAAAGFSAVCAVFFFAAPRIASRR